MTQPNILLIIADCLRSDYLTGQIGQADTPFLDAKGREGVIFTDMISAMSITTPNFTSILSGRYPIEHGVRFLSGQSPSTADLSLIPHLKAEGYHTHALMTGPLFEETGLGHGFDHYQYRSRKEYLDDSWGGRLLAQLKSQHFPEPWFILLHLWELHQPRRISAVSTNHPGTPYEKALTSLDGQLKQLWQVVEAGAAGPVIGALTGDHGEWVETGRLDELWRKGLARLRKITMPNKPKANWHGYHIYDYLVRVPLLVWGRTIPKTAAPITQQIRQIDLLPTLLHAAGLSQPKNITGGSAWPLVYNQPTDQKPAFLEASGGTVLLQTPKWLLGVRHEGWKYAYRPKIAGSEELYNLALDPAEQNNLAAQLPEKAAQLRQLIEKQYLEQAVPTAESDLDLSATEARLRDLGYF